MSSPGDLEDARAELRLVHLVPPLALAFAFLAVASSLSGFFRIFVSMWFHELGHTVTAWLAGYAALPGPWRTSVPDERSWFLTLLVVGGLGYAMYRAYQARHWPLLALFAVLLGLTFSFTLAPAGKVQSLITFGGDAGAMILGALLVTSFYVPPGHRLQVTWLRWGSVFLGAIGFADPFRTWWLARRDPDVIPYGQIEGVGESDPVKLVMAGWSEPQMISRFVWVGVSCLLALMLVHGLGVRAARRRLAEHG